jgi:hypothetical protein
MILIVLRSGCSGCGAAPLEPEVVGWVDPATGAFTAGPPPADAGPCEGACGCVDTICVQRCDDTTGDGTADTTYSELWCVRADGTTSLILTYASDPSVPYTPVSPVECTYGCPESETITLCDDTGPFLRRYTFLAGTATHEDVELDGQTPHLVTGTVGVCAGGSGGGTVCAGTICVTRCDDTDGDGAADQTYSELWCVAEDGTTSLLLTYSTDPSTPYIPVAPVECVYGTTSSTDLLLCDDTGPFLRRITITGGEGVAEDYELDGTTPHLVAGTVGVCPAGPECDQPTTPVATVGLCLPGGAPIAVLVTRDCAGTVTQTGWLNLTTGTYSAGAPPVGAAACGDGRAFELTGVLCDTDPATGDVLGLVLIQYSYNPDGSLAGVQLINPADGTLYTLQGELLNCPGGVELPEQDLVVLCDIAADGTSAPFLRDFRRDTAGLVTGHTDYRLDGTSYAPTGTVGLCPPEPAPVIPSVFHGEFVVCDDNGPFVRKLIQDAAGAVTGVVNLTLDGAVYTPVGAVGVCPAEVTGTVLPTRDLEVLCDVQADGTSTPFVRDYQRDPATGDVTGHADYTLAGAVYAPTGTVGVCTPPPPELRDVEVTRLCLIDDASGTVLQHVLEEIVYDETGVRVGERIVDAVTGGPVSVPGGASVQVCPQPAGRDVEAHLVCILDPTGEVVGRALAEWVYDDATGARVAVRVVDPLTGAEVPLAAGQVVGECAAEPCPIVRVIDECRCDDTDGDGVGDTDYIELIGVSCDGSLVPLGTYREDLTGPYTPVAPVDCPVEGAPEPECPKHLLEQCRWDDTTGDGLGDTEYVELIQVDGCTGALTSLGAYLPDLSGPYTPIAPTTDCPAEGAPDARGVQARRVQLAPGAAWDAAGVALLQSVTATAHGGTGQITTADGPTTLFAGESVTWSVQRDADAALAGPLIIAADTGTVTVTWTQGVTL